MLKDILKEIRRGNTVYIAAIEAEIEYRQEGLKWYSIPWYKKGKMKAEIRALEDLKKHPQKYGVTIVEDEAYLEGRSKWWNENY